MKSNNTHEQTNSSLRMILLTSRPLIGYYDIEEENGKGYQLIPTNRIETGQAVPIDPLERALDVQTVFNIFSDSNAPVTLRWLSDGTIDSLRHALNEGCDVFYFDGHATGEHFLFESEWGEAHVLSANDVALLLKGTGVQLVVLSACQSAQAITALHRAKIPAIVGMLKDVHPRIAATFADGFFGQIARGQTLYTAFQFGKTAIVTQFGLTPEDAHIPILNPPRSSRRLIPMGMRGCFQGRMPQPAQHNLPQPATGSLFVGREETQVELNRLLKDWQVVTLYGPPGVGKTALACEVARWHATRRKFEAVIFYSTEAQASIAGFLQSVGSVLHTHFRELITITGLEAALASALAYFQHHPVLMVLDNFETVLAAADSTPEAKPEELSESAISQESAHGFIDFLARIRGASRLLVTTRNHPVHLEGEKEVRLPGLERQEIGGKHLNPALDLFTFYAAGEAGLFLEKGEPQTINTICDGLGNLPLALKIAASLVKNRPSFSLSQLLFELQQERGHRTLIMTQRGVSQRLRDYPLSLTLSYRYLSVAARRVLAALSIFRRAFDETAITVILEVERTAWEKPLDELVRHSLVDVQAEPELWKMVPIIRSFAFEKLKTERQLGLDAVGLHSKAADDFRLRSHQMTTENYRDFVEAHYHLQQAHRHEEAAALVEQVAQQMLRWGYWTDLEQMLTASIQSLPDDRWELYRYSGQVCEEKGDFTRAEACYQKALSVLREPGEGKGRGRVLLDVGTLFRKRGEYEKAREQYEAVLEMEGDLNRSEVAHAHLNLGVTDALQRRYSEALHHCQTALDIYQELEDLHYVGVSYNNIGGILLLQDRYEDALFAFQKALDNEEYRRSPKEEARVHHNMGYVYLHVGEYEHALGNYQRALQIQEKLGDLHGMGQSYLNSGEALYHQGHHDSANAMYRNALETARTIGDRFVEAASLNNIGELFQAQADYEAAAHKYHEALRLAEQLQDIRMKAILLHNFGELYRLQGQFSEALDMYDQSLELKKRQDYRYGIADTYLSLGQLYATQKKKPEAYEYLTRALNLFTQLSAKAKRKQVEAVLAQLEVEDSPDGIGAGRNGAGESI